MSNTPMPEGINPRRNVRSRKKKVAAIAGAIVAVVGLIAGALQIAQYLEDHSKPPVEGVPRFNSELRSKDAATNFLQFLEENDSKVVYLKVGCTWTGAKGDPWDEIFAFAKEDRCFAFQEPPKSPDDHYEGVSLLVAIGDNSAYEVWYTNTLPYEQRHAKTSFVEMSFSENSDTDVSNGSKGAGWLAINGYFTVMRTIEGDSENFGQFLLRGATAGESSR
jgi:hypothetical protein